MEEKIVIVDDDEGILEAFTAMLESENYNVSGYSNGDSLLKISKEKMPTLIILDVLLSGQDGREICKQLKQNPETKKIPIIMISAHPSIEKSVQECGADDFIKKPFEMDDMLKKVSKYVKKKI